MRALANFTAPADAVVVDVPVRVPSVSNLREHWGAGHRRNLVQQKAVALLLRPALRRRGVKAGPFRVTLWRLSRQRIRDEHDNLRAAFKSIADQVAEELGVDDSTVEWRYGQQFAVGSSVRICVEVLP